MGFFSNLFHRDHHSKSVSVLQTSSSSSTTTTTHASTSALQPLHRTTDDLPSSSALNGKLSDTSLISKSNSSSTNSTTRNRHSMDSSGSSSSWSLSSNGGQLTLNTSFPPRLSISSSSSHHHHHHSQSHLSVQPTSSTSHHHHHHHHHHGPIHIATRVSIRDFAKQYLELLEVENTRALLQNSQAQDLVDPSIHHHTVVTKSLNVIVEAKQSSNNNKTMTPLLKVTTPEVDPANEIVLDNEDLDSKKVCEAVHAATTDPSDQTISNEVSPVMVVDGVTSENNISVNDSAEMNTEFTTLSQHEKEMVTPLEETHQKTNHHEKTSFNKFLTEHEHYLSSLDEIFQVCIYGHVERLKTLLEEHRQKSNRFSLSMKSLRLTGSVEVKESIACADEDKREHVKKQSWSNCTLVHLAARFNQVDVLDMLFKNFIGMNETLADVINLEDDIHATPLFHSVTSGAYESTAFLCSFSNAIKINTKDVFECSPLWYAMNRKDFEMSDILITFGADMFYKIHGGESYLHRACEMNDVDMIKYILLGIGKDQRIDLTNTEQNQLFQERQSLMLRSDQRHQIPLFNAIKSYEEFLRRKKRAHQNGATTMTPSSTSPSTTTNNTSSHLISEPKQEQAFDFLLNFFTEHCPGILQKALDQTNHYGHSMIHFCVERDAFQPLLKIIRLFDSDDKLKQALNEKDKILGNTPLHIAIMTTHYDCFKLLVSCQEVELNIPNQQLDLPLHVAIRQRKLRMIQYLYSLYSQKDLETKNAQHLSCLKLAKRLSLNLKKLAEGNIEEFEKELKSKEKKNEKKWWHIFKIHKKNSQETTSAAVAATSSSTGVGASETISSSNLSSLTKNTLDSLSSSSNMSQQQATTTFPLVHWTKDLTLGVDIMDEQHHGLVDIINKLIQLMFGGENDCNVPERSNDEWLLGYVIGLCLEYTEFHFETEERIMAKYAKLLPEGYAEEHHQEHEEFTSKMKKLHQEYLDNHSTISFLNVDLLNYLLHWLINHIMGSDHVFVSHLTKDVPAEQISLS
ncbi:hypothetical protein C9374_008111 [Naegleria lovaniensis]|uniref:Hemerythrin-like domain-containing protein n=1 Tax=Naegleria lovaniensis TaxID=51637 RepID=A0AA88GFG2_NAELO|nr:uncharacterized protein C9374_008111 [Naegleria lovaniensis]KAG2378472.1 hypothetical protein C9374_008111 [Naegleria lovaniensis]